MVPKELLADKEDRSDEPELGDMFDDAKIHPLTEGPAMSDERSQKPSGTPQTRITQ